MANVPEASFFIMILASKKRFSLHRKTANVQLWTWVFMSKSFLLCSIIFDILCSTPKLGVCIKLSHSQGSNIVKIRTVSATGFFKFSYILQAQIHAKTIHDKLIRVI